MAHIPAIAHWDVSDMSIKDPPSVAYLSSRISWLPPYHFPLALAMILTALSSAYSRYKPKNPLSEEAP